MLLHLKPAERNGKGETVAQILVNLPLKIVCCANFVEDFLSLILQENEKENILQFGDILLLALNEKLLLKYFASSGPWDGNNETHFSNFLLWCPLKTVIKDLKDVFLWGRVRK